MNGSFGLDFAQFMKCIRSPRSVTFETFGPMKLIHLLPRHLPEYV